ncbi:MAG: bifunctional DNA primase/polymerase [Apilactobacillus sp.]|nr:bifunctional DNA primase/polymerase [Apilactobacillus sp.]
MQNLVNYAIAYAKAGLSVLPMIDKKPLIKFADQPALTIDEIKKIWKKYPYANIALRTDKFFVVDIDRHEGSADGFKSIEQYRDKLPETLAQRTAGGGEQLFYLKRDEKEVRQNIGWLDGVDIKAHHNNYVVVSPSTIGDRKYEWLNKKPMVHLGKDMVKEINKTSNASGDMDFTDVKPMKTKTTLLFETIINGLGDNGGRNDNLTHFIGGLLFRSVDPEIAYNLAIMANDNTTDPLPMSELNKTFASVQKKEIRRRGAIKN